MSVLSPAQLQQLDQILAGLDPQSDPPADTSLQPGGTESSGPPRRLGRDANTPRTTGPALPLERPTGLDRRRITRDSGPPQFNGMPTTDGRGPRPYGQSANYGFAGDAALEDRTLRAQLRQMGVPVGEHGGLGNTRRIARQYGLPTGGMPMALDAAPQPSGDIDAPLDAIAHIGLLSYTGRVLSDPPRARPADMALDADSGMNSVAAHFPSVVANWLKNDRSAFTAPVAPGLDRADERNIGRRPRAAPMAFDTAGRAAASRAPSIEATFGSSFAQHLGKIGLAR